MRALIFQFKIGMEVIDFSEVSIQELLEKYDVTYAVKVEEISRKTLEKIFRDGNVRLPLKYSLSVGDLIVFTEKGKVLDAYVCVPVGWKKLKVR